jgi:hypothetical protein
MNRLVSAVSIACIAVSLADAGELSVKPSAAMQVTRTSSRGNRQFVDKGFVRGETKFAGTTDKGSNGLLHLRFQSDIAAKGVSLGLRQCYWQIPVSNLAIRLGRWYESYTPGAYFGRFLYGLGSVKRTVTEIAGTEIGHEIVDDTITHVTKEIVSEEAETIGYGSGSMKTSYTILDGLRLAYAFAPEGKLDIHAGLLTSDSRFERIDALVGITSTPFEALSLGLWGTIGANVPAGDTRTNRMAATAAYSIIEGLKPFVEVGVTDLAEAGDNTWIVGGLDIPTGTMLDLLRFECEYKKERFTKEALDEEDAPDFAWMLILSKKIKKVAFDLNVGADPKSLGTMKASEIGAHLRMTLKM